MSFKVGGEKAWLVRFLGDIGIAYHWLDNEPAMFLFPCKKEGQVSVFVIPLPSAYNYVKSNGDPDLDYLNPTALKAAVHMGFMRTDRYVIRSIIDAICDGMPDLVSMPPEPKDHVEQAVQNNVGEMSLTIDGETIAQKEIPDLPANEFSGVAH